MEIDFLQACRNGDRATVQKHLKVDIDVILSTDERQNTCLHLGVISNHINVVQIILDFCALHARRCDIVNLKNDQKKTALELAWELNHRTVAWAIVRSGRSSGSLRNINVLDVVHGQNGDNVLHTFARGNYFDEIKKYLDSCDKPFQFIKLCLERNCQGNLPATLAAQKGHKEALMLMLQPFFSNCNLDELEELLHAENKDGQRIISYVSHYRNSLSVAHGMLIEMESMAHNQNSFEVKDCLRTSLGSSQNAKFSVELFQRIRSERTQVESLTAFFRILSLTFMLRTVFLILDMISDMALIEKYWNEWGEQQSTRTEKIFYPGEVEASNDPCIVVAQTHVDGGNVVSHEYGTTNATLGCYAGAFKGRERFILTLLIFTFPFLLYFFELLRFRILSSRLDLLRPRLKSKLATFLIFGLVKPIGNALLWATWPLVMFFRHFWFTYQFDSNLSDPDAHSHKITAKNAAFISSRAQLIEVCTEASLQPIFQFYLVFQDFIHVDVRSFLRTDEILDNHKLQLVSVVLSLFTLSWSYTAQYRQNKENSIGIFVTLYYFLSVAMLVTSRILIFEMFAYSLGSGLFGHAMGFVAAHVLLMSILHLIFSDSAAHCRRRRNQSHWQWIRQMLLAIHNCLINGLANMYVHNNLEIFIQEKAKQDSPASYVTSDVRQRTLIRQTICDAIILTENIFMISFVMSKVEYDANTFKETLTLTIIVITLYLVGMGMKIFFYCWCHPWSELIRPQSYSQYIGSCVIFSKHIDYSLNVKTCQHTLTQNLESDRKRYESIKTGSSTTFKDRKLSPAIRVELCDDPKDDPSQDHGLPMNVTPHPEQRLAISV